MCMRTTKSRLTRVGYCWLSSQLRSRDASKSFPARTVRQVNSGPFPQQPLRRKLLRKPSPPCPFLLVLAQKTSQRLQAEESARFVDSQTSNVVLHDRKLIVELSIDLSAENSMRLFEFVYERLYAEPFVGLWVGGPDVTALHPSRHQSAVRVLDHTISDV